MATKKKFKYVHILWRNEVKFNGPLVQLINDPENGFNINDHVFVTPYSDTYEALKHYENVILDDSGKNLFNVYAECSDWIFSHSSRGLWNILTIKKKNLNKIIWRTWGGTTVGCRLRDGQIIRNAVKRLINKCYLRQMSGFAAIGYANVVDILGTRKNFKDTPMYRMPYAVRGRYDALEQIMQLPPREDGYTHVLVGHRSDREEHHIQILETLQKFADEKIRIFVPLSYGDAKYTAEIKAYVEKNHLKNVVIIDQFMPYEEYAKLLNDMDVAIFDGSGSYALGNISVLLLFNKKLFIKREGLIRETFDYQQVPYSCIDEIKDMSFSEFARPVIYPEGCRDEIMYRSFDKSLNNWRELLTVFN